MHTLFNIHKGYPYEHANTFGSVNVILSRPVFVWQTLKFVGAEDATEKVWEERAWVPVVVQALLSNTDYCKSPTVGATPEEDLLKERFPVERLLAWFDSTQAQEAKARIKEKNKTGAAGRRPPTKFKEMRTARWAMFFGKHREPKSRTPRKVHGGSEGVIALRPMLHAR